MAGQPLHQQSGERCCECILSMLKSWWHVVHIVHIILYILHIARIKEYIYSKLHIGHVIWHIEHICFTHNLAYYAYWIWWHIVTYQHTFWHVVHIILHIHWHILQIESMTYCAYSADLLTYCFTYFSSYCDYCHILHIMHTIDILFSYFYAYYSTYWIAYYEYCTFCILGILNIFFYIWDVYFRVPLGFHWAFHWAFHLQYISYIILAYCAYNYTFLLTYFAIWIDGILCIFCIFINILF